MKGSCWVALYVCLSVCLAGREDRLTNTDDLEQMLRALEKDIRQGDAKNKDTADMAESLSHDPALKERQSPPGHKDPAIDKSENSETLLEELKHIVQQLSRQSKGTPTTEEVETTVPTTLTVTAETSQDTQNKASLNPDQSKADIGMDKLKQLLKQYYDKWTEGQPERPSTKLTRRTSLEKLLSLRAAKLEELKKSALDVASRASLLYLRLKQL